MAALTGDQIREAARNTKIDRERMVIPELGGEIWVRGQSGQERDKFEEGLRIKKGRLAGQSDLRAYRARYATKVIVNADGERLLNDSDLDINLLGRLPSGVLDRIIAKSNELSGKAPEEIEELGNASASQTASDDSASSSPSGSEG